MVPTQDPVAQTQGLGRSRLRRACAALVVVPHREVQRRALVVVFLIEPLHCGSVREADPAMPNRPKAFLMRNSCPYDQIPNFNQIRTHQPCRANVVYDVSDAFELKYIYMIIIPHPSHNWL